MFFYPIDEQLQLKLITEKDADELFAFIERNRRYLREWLGWLDHTQQAADTRAFTTMNLRNFAEGLALDTAIVYDGKIVGKMTINKIDRATNTAHFGYMLDEQYSGKGIMTRAVKAMETIAFMHYDVTKIEIRAAVGNVKSRAIAERLGYTLEGTIRQAEWLYDHYVDHAVYGLLKDEWAERAQ